MRAWPLLLTGCVAPQIHTGEQVDLFVELAEGQTEASFELVLDIREGGMPDPQYYEGDELWVDASTRGRFELDVMLGTEPKPRKGGQDDDGWVYFRLEDIAATCPSNRPCQRVVTVDMRRQRTAEGTLDVLAGFRMFSLQATVNAFPNTATEQEIRLRAFER